MRPYGSDMAQLSRCPEPHFKYAITLDKSLTEGDIALIVGGVIAAIIVLAGIRVIRPTHVGAIETLGRFSGFRRYGITYVFPAIQKLYKGERDRAAR